MRVWLDRGETPLDVLIRLDERFPAEMEVVIEDEDVRGRPVYEGWKQYLSEKEA